VFYFKSFLAAQLKRSTFHVEIVSLQYVPLFVMYKLTLTVFWQLGTLVASVVLKTREAEQAMEEAKIAAHKAELYFMEAHKNAKEVTELLEKFDSQDTPLRRLI
jgi:hypothetical protein